MRACVVPSVVQRQCFFACVTVERCEDLLEYDLFAAWSRKHECRSSRCAGS